jgi:hypothetical protein
LLSFCIESSKLPDLPVGTSVTSGTVSVTCNETCRTGSEPGYFPGSKFHNFHPVVHGILEKFGKEKVTKADIKQARLRGLVADGTT